jgi:enamine deaminase RidA (YjgF/YER057c/UK114 family)
MKIASTDENTGRRSAIRSLAALIAAAGGGLFGIARAQSAQPEAARKAPLFAGSKSHGGLVCVAGKGEPGPGDITVHTKAVLDKIEEELKKAGSSMDKVLKVNVYLHDLRDYDAMNEAYRGRFGDNPPVRTTVACYGGIPGGSLVEIDCIAVV